MGKRNQRNGLLPIKDLLSYHLISPFVLTIKTFRWSVANLCKKSITERVKLDRLILHVQKQQKVHFLFQTLTGIKNRLHFQWHLLTIAVFLLSLFGHFDNLTVFYERRLLKNAFKETDSLKSLQKILLHSNHNKL